MYFVNYYGGLKVCFLLFLWRLQALHWCRRKDTMLAGRDAFLPSPVAGGSGALSTLLLAFCLLHLARKD